MGRIIAIGDVHGCFQELETLLKTLKPTRDDLLIQIGDLINRGPGSAESIALAREYRIKCLLGNHENRLLRYHWSKEESILKKYDFETLEELSHEDWLFLESMPLFHHEAYMQTVFVHGGFLPFGEVPWFQQSVEIVTEIQVIDEDGHPGKRSKNDWHRPWADFWNGPPFVVYGHTPRSRVYRKPWSLGIDTSCVYGGHLTAFILPGGKIVQVPAKDTYVLGKSPSTPIE